MSADSTITAVQVITWLNDQAASLEGRIKELQERAIAYRDAAKMVRSYQIPQRRSVPEPLPDVSDLLSSDITHGLDLDKPPHPQLLARVKGVTPDAIRSVIRLRGMRPGDLAGHFHISEEAVRAVINDPDSGLVIADRGWVKRKEDAA